MRSPHATAQARRRLAAVTATCLIAGVSLLTATVKTSGKAKAVFEKITAKGKYTVTGSYAGSTTANPSTGKVSFKVS